MEIAAFILGLIGTLTGGAALYFQWRAHQRDVMKFRHEMEQEERDSAPFFCWKGGSDMIASAAGVLISNREFENAGAPITKLALEFKPPIKCQIVPGDFLAEGGEGRIGIELPGVTARPDLRFIISYTTKLGVRKKAAYRWSRNGSIELIIEPQSVARSR